MPPGSVPPQVISTLVLCFGGVGVTLALISAFWLVRFPISREQHEARLERLAHRRARPLDEASRADPDGHSIGI